MSTQPKPEALRLADEWLRKTQSEADRRNSAYDHFGMDNTPEKVDPLGAKMAAELRRLHALTQGTPSGDAGNTAQEGILHCYWMMLRECESKADDDNDPVLRHQVEGFYRLWNRVQGSSLWPIWVERAARKQGGAA